MTRLRTSLNWLAAAALVSAAPAALAETADLLVLYTDSATQHPNGRDIQARIQAAVEWTNQALRNSQTDFQLRLVKVARADAKYNGNLTSSDLSALRNDPDVARLRREVGADFVTMIGPSTEWCGIGYVSSGNASTGQLYSSSSGWAYNLVSISCGFSTFAHELGHNFGLGHSNLQNSRGGVWPWARGHGEVGVFTTIMGYTGAFQTNNRVQYYSNPNLNACEGRACGVPVGQSMEADSAQNIRRLNSQLAAFLPTVVDGGGNGGGNGGGTGGGNGGGTGGSLCPAGTPETNLVQEGEFNALDPWASAFGRSVLDTWQETTDSCVDNRLRITQRTAWYSGVSQDLTEALAQGGTFALSLKARLDAAQSGQRAYATLRLQDSAGFRYQYLAVSTLKGTDWADLAAEFKPDWRGTPQKAELLIYGPAAGSDLLVDKVSVVKKQSTTPPAHLYAASFEKDLDGWKSGWGATLDRVTDAAEGSYALRVTGRDSWADGAWQDLTGLLTAGTDYRVQASVKHGSGKGNQNYTLYLLYRDNNGWHWQRLYQGTQAGGRWNTLSADFRITASGLTDTRLYVMGPASGVNFKLDAVTVDKR